MSPFAPTALRAEVHTSDRRNDLIHERMLCRLASIADDEHALRERLAELDQEWDIERCLETGAATLTLTGLVLGTTLDRRWFILSGVVQGFFMQHALQGWCPPLPVFRSLGVRTQREIEAERHAIKALLGHYERGPDADNNRRGFARRLLEIALNHAPGRRAAPTG